MKEIRKDVQKNIKMQNGLVVRQLPQIYKLQYDPQTEDIFTFERTRLNQEEIALSMYESTLQFAQVWKRARTEQDQKL